MEKFERFCAEYFHRQGYETILGPGSNDDGVDVKIFDKNDVTKPLILVQCKRYKEKDEVKVEAVKALYTDVEFENRTPGAVSTRRLIATTSYIAPKGKKVCEARQYPLSFAENDKVKNWALQMWRYNKLVGD